MVFYSSQLIASGDGPATLSDVPDNNGKFILSASLPGSQPKTRDGTITRQTATLVTPQRLLQR
jgi:hypothetical protein